MRARFIAFALLIIAPASAQVSYPPAQPACRQIYSSNGTVTVGNNSTALLLQVAYPPPAPQWTAQQTVTLDAAGNATWTFDALNPPAVVPAVVHMPKAMDTTNPVMCNFTSVSTTSVTIHCWRTTLLGLLTSLYSGSVAGAQVNLVARAIP